MSELGHIGSPGLDCDRAVWSKQQQRQYITTAGLILGLHPANERRRYKITPSLIGLAQT